MPSTSQSSIGSTQVDAPEPVGELLLKSTSNPADGADQQSSQNSLPANVVAQHDVPDRQDGQEPPSTHPNTGDRRHVPRDRRNIGGDRRGGSLRRGLDRQRNMAANQIAYLGTLFCALSVGIGVYAFLRAPITFSPSPACNEGFGGQRIEHRGLSILWSLVMVLAAAGLVIPDRKRRPVVLMILCGVSLGLFAGAYLTVGSKFVGFCID